jgi:hypothetical protein
MNRILVIILPTLILPVFLSGCSESQIEEFAFRKTMEHELTELCGETDKACISAVKSQVKDCMVSSDWRKYLKNDESEEEFNRFVTEFYGCIVDSDGNPYFAPN